MRLASNENVARTVQSQTEGKNWIQRQFRGENPPRNAALGPPSRPDEPLTSETKRRVCKSLRLTFFFIFD